MASNYPDPMEAGIRPERVNYENGVLLDENDFKDEQTYFRGRLGRALAFLHGSGTVAGLEVAESLTQAHVIVVNAGLALDPLGRLIELPVPYCIRAPEWFAAQNQQDLAESFANSGIDRVIVDLFIRFNVCGRGMTPYLGGGNTEGTDAFTYNRLLDGVAFEMEIRTELPPDRPTPDPFQGLPAIDPTDPPSPAEALAAIKNHKYTRAWDEDKLSGTSDNRVLLSRIQLPCTESPMTYDTNGSIVFNDSVRLLSFTSIELFWLINAMRGDQS
jgi:hypothetical protein